MSVMVTPILHCEDERRRRLARDKGWTGIDCVEVVDDLHHLELCVHFFGECFRHFIGNSI